MLLIAAGGLRMLMLSPAVQMPALATSQGCLTAVPQYIGATAALQPAIHNITGYRLPHANTYVLLVVQVVACYCWLLM